MTNVATYSRFRGEQHSKTEIFGDQMQRRGENERNFSAPSKLEILRQNYQQKLLLEKERKIQELHNDPTYMTRFDRHDDGTRVSVRQFFDERRKLKSENGEVPDIQQHYKQVKGQTYGQKYQMKRQEYTENKIPQHIDTASQKLSAGKDRGRTLAPIKDVPPLSQNASNNNRPHNFGYNSSSKYSEHNVLNTQAHNAIGQEYPKADTRQRESLIPVGVIYSNSKTKSFKEWREQQRNLLQQQGQTPSSNGHHVSSRGSSQQGFQPPQTLSRSEFQNNHIDHEISKKPSSLFPKKVQHKQSQKALQQINRRAPQHESDTEDSRGESRSDSNAIINEELLRKQEELMRLIKKEEEELKRLQEQRAKDEEKEIEEAEARKRRAAEQKERQRQIKEAAEAQKRIEAAEHRKEEEEKRRERTIQKEMEQKEKDRQLELEIQQEQKAKYGRAVHSKHQDDELKSHNHKNKDNRDDFSEPNEPVFPSKPRIARSNTRQPHTAVNNTVPRHTDPPKKSYRTEEIEDSITATPGNTDAVEFYVEEALQNPDAYGKVDLATCSECGKRFAKDRLQKHRNICKKTKNTKRKVFDPVKMRVEGTDFAKYAGAAARRAPTPKKNLDWKAKHEEFIQNIRYAKQAAAMEKQGLAPPPMPKSKYQPDRTTCPHCNRAFNSDAAERHIPICVKLKTRRK